MAMLWNIIICSSHLPPLTYFLSPPKCLCPSLPTCDLLFLITAKCSELCPYVYECRIKCLNFIYSFIQCVCVYVYERIVHLCQVTTWRLEDNFREPVFSCLVGPEDRTLVPSPTWRQAPLSAAPSPQSIIEPSWASPLFVWVRETMMFPPVSCS